MAAWEGSTARKVGAGYQRSASGFSLYAGRLAAVCLPRKPITTYPAIRAA